MQRVYNIAVREWGWWRRENHSWAEIRVLTKGLGSWLLARITSIYFAFVVYIGDAELISLAFAQGYLKIINSGKRTIVVVEW